MFTEEAEEAAKAAKAAKAELEKEDLEDRQKDEFFDDTLPSILTDKKRGAEFLDFVTRKDNATIELLQEKRLWLVRDWAKYEFRLERPGEDGILATWDEDEFFDALRGVAWDDPDTRDFLLDGSVKEAWDTLDDTWYVEDEDGLVVDSVGKFLADIENAKKDSHVGLVRRDVAVCEEADTGRVEIKMVWSQMFPDEAELTFSRDGEEEALSVVPLAFLRWWRFCRERDW